MMTDTSDMEKTWRNKIVWTAIPPHIEKFRQHREFQSANFKRLAVLETDHSKIFQVPKQAIKTPVAEDHRQILTVHVLFKFV